MRYITRNRQVSYGEAIGILLLDSVIPFIPGDVANATTYDFPVRFKKVTGFTVDRAIGRDASIYDDLLTASRDLAANGVRAITGDCGFMALHQERLQQDLGLPVFLSSLLQIPFIRHLVPAGTGIGIITADRRGLTPAFLEQINIPSGPDLFIQGMENSLEFAAAVLEEKGTLDADKIQEEAVAAARVVSAAQNIGAILLECSVLPPYARAVHDATGLPVFDYITMINHVFHALEPRRYCGFM
ncbi:MAG: aspartate/glutamate racemase family protein [Desulfotignum sp.]|nr:aspartate/glutamate racemase family protein [Desulfotignum sp.]MCF8113028.1 aspartate/glutamate racemase family protein [Desulfotignum sp.]MCF8124785.1 aspartate/glutamate racemase family protein [Desulfotignum sp.]